MSFAQPETEKTAPLKAEPLVKDLMSTDLFTLYKDDNIMMLDELMKWRRIRHVPVVDIHNKLVGLVTHRDFLKVAISRLAEVDTRATTAVYREIKVASIMKTLVATVHPETTLAEAAQYMVQGKFGCLPVVQDKELVGILTEADFVKSYFEWNMNVINS